jgi:fructose-specific component phosphotransferase system IIB-like protein
MKKVCALVLVALLALGMVACSDDDSGGTVASGSTGNAINREAILSSVDDVRALIKDNASSLDPQVIDDVDYDNNELKVTLGDSQNDLDLDGLKSMCGQVSNAIALPDLHLVVEKADGSESAECEFAG